jgi:crossover junction endodeoxyribonuclease RusA
VTRPMPEITAPESPELALASWALLLPFQRPRTSNARQNWRVRAQEVRHWRHATDMLCRAQRIPPCQRIRVGLVFAAPDNRRRDASNLADSVKPALDGIVDSGIVRDDTAEFVSVREPLILPGGPSFADGSRVLLTIERLA